MTSENMETSSAFLRFFFFFKYFLNILKQNLSKLFRCQIFYTGLMIY